MSRRTPLTLVVSVLVAAACSTAGGGSGPAAIEPRDGKSGLHLSGTVDGRQLVVSDGAPELRLGDCDVNDGSDGDLCFFSQEVDGGFFAMIVENPEAVVEGRVEVVGSSCRSPQCEEVGAGAIVDLQFDPGGPRTRATGGNLTLSTVEEARRYGGTLNLDLPDGRVGGTFQIVPRPEEPSE